MFSRVISIDFDGVLHPSGGPPGEALPFCWVAHLAEDLAPYPDVGLLVHSTWIERFTLDEICEFLAPLDSRVIGSVSSGPKARAIETFVVTSPQTKDWLVIDDDPIKFSRSFPGSLLICDPRMGISDPKTRQLLRDWLATSPGA